MIVTTIFKNKNLNGANGRFCCDLNLNQITTEDSQSVDFEGDGSQATPIVANVKVSADPLNVLELKPDGFFAPGDGGSFYDDALAIAAIAGALNTDEIEFAAGQFSLNEIPFSKLTGVPGFLTSEADPVFTASAAAGIIQSDIDAWDASIASILALQGDVDDLDAADIALANDIADINIVTAGFTGTTTKTLTLTKGDGSTVTAAFNDTGLNDTLYATDGTLPGPRVVNMAGYPIHWLNSGLFRITEGDLTTGAVYDFNDGIDFLNYDATYSANIKQNSVTGISFSIVDVVGATLLQSLDVTPDGYRLQNIPEYADNSAASGAGLSAGYIYRTGDNLKIVH